MGLGKNRHMDQWNRAESQETDHTSTVTDLRKNRKFNGERIGFVFLKNKLSLNN